LSYSKEGSNKKIAVIEFDSLNDQTMWKTFRFEGDDPSILQGKLLGEGRVIFILGFRVKIFGK
jgi:hypothetical protein